MSGLTVNRINHQFVQDSESHLSVHLIRGPGAQRMLEPELSHLSEAPMNILMERNHLLDAHDRALAQTQSSAWAHE